MSNEENPVVVSDEVKGGEHETQHETQHETTNVSNTNYTPGGHKGQEEIADSLDEIIEEVSYDEEPPVTFFAPPASEKQAYGEQRIKISHPSTPERARQPRLEVKHLETLANDNFDGLFDYVKLSVFRITPTREQSAEMLIESAKKWFFYHIDVAKLDRIVAAELLLSVCRKVIARYNATCKEGDRVVKTRASVPAELSPTMAAELVYHCEHVYRSAETMSQTPDDDLLLIYESDPTNPAYGTYVSDKLTLKAKCWQFACSPAGKSFDVFYEHLHMLADRQHRDRGAYRDLIPVANGIIDYRTKELLPFSPEYVFTTKAAVKYSPDAKSPLIHNDDDGTEWDVESWIADFFDDPEMTELIWQIIGATLRPYVSWNKAAFFYSESGNNGKGTLIALMRAVLGGAAYASIPLADFGKDFMLEPLLRVSAILVDENDVGTFIDKAANFKAIVTNDLLSINRKFLPAVTHRFHGFMVQCLNELPKIKDRSESLYRRQIFIPFEKSFTGAERKYIKDEYIQRQDVLEYVLWRVINMPDYYSFIEPEATRSALEEYKEYNDPVRAFWLEFKDEFVWDLVPYDFLYSLYKAWLERTSPSATPLGRNTFRRDLFSVVTGDSDWIVDKTSRHSPNGRMDTPEILILEYDLKDWQNPRGGKANPAALLKFDKKETYKGLLRVQPRAQSEAPTETDTDEAMSIHAAVESLDVPMVDAPAELDITSGEYQTPTGFTIPKPVSTTS